MSSSRRAAFLIACGLALRAAVAAGQTLPAAPEHQPSPPPPIGSEPTARPVERWYGWQTLLTDLGVVTLTIAAATSAGHDDDAALLRAALVGGSGFLFGGPIVHAAHGHWTKAGGSLALRAGLSLIGAAIGAGLGESACGQYEYDHEGCSIGYGAVGLFLGAATAMVADAAILGREQITDRADGAASVAFTPLRSGGGLSFVGRF